MEHENVKYCGKPAVDLKELRRALRYALRYMSDH